MFSRDASGIHHLLFLVVYRNCQYISQVHLLLGVLLIIVRLSRLILSLMVLSLDIYQTQV